MGKYVDVLIRGTGPAGSVAAAWLARAGNTVALVRRPATAPLDRIEALGPDIAALLGRIGLDRNWLREIARPIPGTVSRWAGLWEEVQDYVMCPHGPAWSTWRKDFDQALLDYAKTQRGVQLVERDVRAGTRLVAVGSDSAPKGQVDDKLIALTRNYKYCPDGDRRLRIEAAPHGWWYALRASDNALGLGFVTDRQTLKSRSAEELWNEALVGPILELAATASGAGPLRGVLVRCAFAEADRDRIGSARVAYDPLTGRGVAEAVRNAIESVSLKGQDQLAAQKRLVGHYAEYLKERRRLYELVQPDTAPDSGPVEWILSGRPKQIALQLHISVAKVAKTFGKTRLKRHFTGGFQSSRFVKSSGTEKGLALHRKPKVLTTFATSFSAMLGLVGVTGAGVTLPTKNNGPLNPHRSAFLM